MTTNPAQTPREELPSAGPLDALTEPTAPPQPRWVQPWFLSGLLLWGLGAQVSEAFAAAGAGVCLLGLIVLAVRSRDFAWKEWARTWAPLLAFVVWGLLVTFARGPLRSSGAVARHLDWMLLPVAAAAFTRLAPVGRRRLAVGCLLMLMVSCAIAGLQHFGLWPSPERFARWSWTGATFFRVYEAVPNTENRFMAGGLLFHRLKFANVSGLAILAALTLGLRARGTLRLLALAAAALGFVAVFLFPYARAACLALVVASAVALLLEKQHRRMALMLGGGFAVLALSLLLLHDSFRARLLTSASSEGNGGRMHLLATGLSALRQHPLSGTGIGHFQAYRFASPDAPEQVRTHHGKAHNQFLSVAAETGLPGLVLFLYLLQWLVRRMRVSSVTGALGLSVFAFFVVLSFFHDPLFHAEPSLAFAFVLGLAVSRPHEDSPALG